jgi:flagellar biosynthesis protein FlhB
MEKVYNLEQQFNKLSEEIKEVKELYQLKKPIEFVKVLFKI